MRVGSIVQAVADFTEIKRVWPMLPYPNKGDILTVSAVCEHPANDSRSPDAVMLWFEELPGSWGIADKTIHGEDNFVELLLPDDMEEILMGEHKLELSQP